MRSLPRNVGRETSLVLGRNAASHACSAAAPSALCRRGSFKKYAVGKHGQKWHGQQSRGSVPLPRQSPKEMMGESQAAFIWFLRGKT